MVDVARGLDRTREGRSHVDRASREMVDIHSRRSLGAIVAALSGVLSPTSALAQPIPGKKAHVTRARSPRVLRDCSEFMLMLRIYRPQEKASSILGSTLTIPPMAS